MYALKAFWQSLSSVKRGTGDPSLPYSSMPAVKQGGGGGGGRGTRNFKTGFAQRTIIDEDVWKYAQSIVMRAILHYLVIWSATYHRVIRALGGAPDRTTTNSRSLDKAVVPLRPGVVIPLSHLHNYN